MFPLWWWTILQNKIDTTIPALLKSKGNLFHIEVLVILDLSSYTYLCWTNESNSSNSYIPIRVHGIIILYCKWTTFGCVFFLRFWRNVASTWSGTSPNVKNRYIEFRNATNHIHTTLVKNCFPQNIIHAKQNAFTVF